MSDNKAAFRLLGERVAEAAQNALKGALTDALATVKQGYSAMGPVRAEDGTVLSEIDPKTITPAVTARIVGFSGAVFIVGEPENDEAHRQYALGAGTDVQRNPFLAALYRLRNHETLAKSTGLKVK